MNIRKPGWFYLCTFYVCSLICLHFAQLRIYKVKDEREKRKGCQLYKFPKSAGDFIYTIIRSERINYSTEYDGDQYGQSFTKILIALMDNTLNE